MSGDHFVSKFLLKRWATNGQMVSYRWDVHRNDVREETKAGIHKHCAIRGLNNLWGVAHDETRMLEAYFTEKIDTPSALVLEKMLRLGARALTPADRMVWAKFLVALPIRTPDVMLQHGHCEAGKALREAEEFGLASPEDHAIANSNIRQNTWKHRRNSPRRVAIDLIEDPSKFGPILEMRWSMRRWTKRVILIGDRPLLVHPQTTRWGIGFPLDHPQCLIALPVAPNAVFFATFDTKGQQKRRDVARGRLANLLNEETIARCADFVFAVDTSMRNFVTPRLSHRFCGVAVA